MDRILLFYDLLQQFGIDLDSNEKLLGDSNANLTRNALTQLFRTRRSNLTNSPRWYKEMKRLYRSFEMVWNLINIVVIMQNHL